MTDDTHSKNQSQKRTIRICGSHKACQKMGGKYVWERVCNELGINPEQEQHDLKDIFVEKSPCQGHCKKSPNMQVIEPQTKNLVQFHYMNPIEAAKILKKVQTGTPNSALQKKKKPRE